MSLIPPTEAERRLGRLLTEGKWAKSAMALLLRNALQETWFLKSHEISKVRATVVRISGHSEPDASSALPSILQDAWIRSFDCPGLLFRCKFRRTPLWGMQHAVDDEVFGGDVLVADALVSNCLCRSSSCEWRRIVKMYRLRGGTLCGSKN